MGERDSERKRTGAFNDRVREIIGQVGTGVELIRALSRNQAELWRRVPHLALMADGRTGYLDQYHRAYQDGLWTLEACAERGYYQAAVDCATGEIVSTSNPQQPALEQVVLRLVPDHLDQLDAETIIAELTRGARQPISKIISQRSPTWREDLNVPVMYTRHNGLTAEEMRRRDAEGWASDISGW